MRHMLGTGQLVQGEGLQSPQSRLEGQEDPLDLDQILGRTWDRYGSASTSQDLSQQSDEEEEMDCEEDSAEEQPSQD